MGNKKTNNIDKINGGVADNKSPEDLARKHHVFLGTILKELELGVKIEMEHTNNPEIAKEIAMDHIDEYPYYYSDKENGLIQMEKNQEKKLNEDIELNITDENPDGVVADLIDDGYNAGKLYLRIKKINSSLIAIIDKIELKEDEKTIKSLDEIIRGIFVNFPDINKILVSPNPGIVNMNFYGADWKKLYFDRLNDKWLIRLRQ